MSTLKAIQKAPWDREEELSQLRQLCAEQNESLVFIHEILTDEKAFPFSQKVAAAAIEKYNTVVSK